MTKQKRVAFIGSRNLYKLPQEGIEMFILAAELAAKRGYVISTGAAAGSDQLAANTALENGGLIQLHLPWKEYERQWVDRILQQYQNKVQVIDSDPLENSKAVEAISLHPGASLLKESVRRLMGRNYTIVEGCSSVIALPIPPMRGGTAHGMRVAESLGIPLFNLSIPEGREKLSPYLKSN